MSCFIVTAAHLPRTCITPLRSRGCFCVCHPETIHAGYYLNCVQRAVVASQTATVTYAQKVTPHRVAGSHPGEMETVIAQNTRAELKLWGARKRGSSVPSCRTPHGQDHTPVENAFRFLTFSYCGDEGNFSKRYLNVCKHSTGLAKKFVATCTLAFQLR